MNWKKTGVTCIGIKDADGKFRINPPDNTVSTVGRKIIVPGSKNQISDMKNNVG